MELTNIKKLYSAVVTNKQTKGTEFIERKEYATKTQFISDLKGNGYSVNPSKVKESDVFDYIMNYTNCTTEDWKYITSVPADGREYQEMIDKGIAKNIERTNTRTEKHIEECKTMLNEIKAEMDEKKTEVTQPTIGKSVTIKHNDKIYPAKIIDFETFNNNESLIWVYCKELDVELSIPSNEKNLLNINWGIAVETQETIKSEVTPATQKPNTFTKGMYKFTTLTGSKLHTLEIVIIQKNSATKERRVFAKLDGGKEKVYLIQLNKEFHEYITIPQWQTNVTPMDQITAR